MKNLKYLSLSECPEPSLDFFHEAQNLQTLSIEYVTTIGGEPPIVAHRPDFSNLKSLTYYVVVLNPRYLEALLQHTNQRLTFLSLGWQRYLDPQADAQWCIETIVKYCNNLESLSLISGDQNIAVGIVTIFSQLSALKSFDLTMLQSQN